MKDNICSRQSSCSVLILAAFEFPLLCLKWDVFLCVWLCTIVYNKHGIWLCLYKWLIRQSKQWLQWGGLGRFLIRNPSEELKCNDNIYILLELRPFTSLGCMINNNNHTCMMNQNLTWNLWAMQFSVFWNYLIAPSLLRTWKQTGWVADTVWPSLSAAVRDRRESVYTACSMMTKKLSVASEITLSRWPMHLPIA